MRIIQFAVKLDTVYKILRIFIGQSWDDVIYISIKDSNFRLAADLMKVNCPSFYYEFELAVNSYIQQCGSFHELPKFPKRLAFNCEFTSVLNSCLTA